MAIRLYSYWRSSAAYRVRIAPSRDGSTYQFRAWDTRTPDAPLAELTYRVEDRFSVPAARRNLKRADRVEVLEVAGGALTASARLEGAAVWAWGLDPGDGTARPAAGRELPAWLRAILEQKYTSNPARDLLRADRNGDPGYRWAVFHGGGEELVLDVDPRPSARSEELSRLLNTSTDDSASAGAHRPMLHADNSIRQAVSIARRQVDQQWAIRFAPVLRTRTAA